MALLMMTFGLLAVGQLIYLSAGSGALARSEEIAVITAQDKLEFLSDLYRRDPDSAELSAGLHGPEQAESLNPITGNLMNRFEVTWDIRNVPDTRAGRNLRAKLVFVTVTPVTVRGVANTKPSLNKALKVSHVLSGKQQ